MSRKHFVALAAKLKGQYPVAGNHEQHAILADQWRRMVEAVADVCASTNPAFNRERFIAACRGIS